MLRTRVIRPGICTNVVLAKLGPEATLLFERLWMLADREGRLIDDPERIKAEAIPYFNWPVENLLKSLWKTGFIRRYKVPSGGASGRFGALLGVIEIINFKRHQWIHQSEAQSVLPPPPVNNRKHKARIITSPGNSRTAPGNSPESPAYTSNSNGNKTNTGESRARDTADDTGRENPPLNTPEEKPKPPDTARRSRNRRSGPPAEHPPRSPAPVDFWPYSPEDVRIVRESLNSLAQELRMSPPDDGIIRRILDAAGGAGGGAIHETLHRLYGNRRFREMRSWGLIPVILAPLFHTAAAS